MFTISYEEDSYKPTKQISFSLDKINDTPTYLSWLLFFIKDDKIELNKLYSAYTPFSWHEKIFNYARKKKLLCFSSPFDKTSVDLLEKLNESIQGRLRVKYHMHKESLRRFCEYLKSIPAITSIEFSGIGLRDDSFVCKNLFFQNTINIILCITVP